MKHTIVNLVDTLVEQGVIDRDKAEQLKREARAKAKVQARKEALAEAPVDEPPADEPSSTVRVPYVPEFVKEEIREDVRAELRGEVAADVVAQARAERWGVPAALPDWTRRFSFDGDIRLRAQGDFFASDNLAFGEPGGGFFVDYEQLNEDGGVLSREALINSSEDGQRGRLRLRLGITAEVLENLDAVVRISTGEEGNATSVQRTLSNDFGSYDLVIDRAYMRYIMHGADRAPWLTLTGGRMPNPYMHTQLLWDPDTQFDGAAANLRLGLPGPARPSVFANLGLFPLEEVELDENDKWLWGAQGGASLTFSDDSRLQLGAAYYDYNNITGRINPLNQTVNDFTAPSQLQKGNSLFDISNIDTDGDGFVEPNQRFGLASDFNILNLTARYDLARFAPIHVTLTADYVNNLGWDEEEIRARLNGRNLIVNNLPPSIAAGSPENDETEGYYAEVRLGWPNVFEQHSWRLSLAYKYLERDAVLDAFAESNFLLGGTNAKGWIIEGRYGLFRRGFLQARYISADEIEGPPLGIDVLQVDFGLEF